MKMKLGLDITSTGKPTLSWSCDEISSDETIATFEEDFSILQIRTNEILDKMEDELITRWQKLNARLK